MKRLMLFAVICAGSLCFAEEPGTTLTPTVEFPQVMKREIGLRIDPLTKEQLDAGLTLDMIKDALTNELELGSLTVNPSLNLPSLVLRIRTVQVGLDMATFFQLSFQEEAMLVRTRSMFYATTWSQSSILTCAPQNLKKEILDTVSVLTRTFIKEYNKAMKPAGT